MQARARPSRGVKRVLPVAVAAVLLLGAVACGRPVPDDKSSFVGAWSSPTVSLHITQEGRVRYTRLREGGLRTSIDGPLQGFSGDSFAVGVGFLSTTFEVSVPPHRRDDGSWAMTVDGVELTRGATPAAAASDA